MSKFLDDLLHDLEQPESETPDEVAAEVEHDEAELEVEDSTEPDEGVAEEVVEAEEPKGAPEVTDAEDDDETDLTPVERKAWGRLKALQDERTKRQSAEADRDRLNEQLAEMHRQQQAASAQNLPDPYSDPEGYLAAREAQFQEQLTRQALGFSINRAVEKYGEAEVEEAAKWFENQIATNPHIPLRNNMLSQADQMEYVLSSYKQAKQIAAFASGDVSHIVAELQKQGYQISKADTSTATAKPAAPVTPQVENNSAPAKTAPAAPKRSKLAGASSATTAPASSGSMMDAVLRR